MSCLVEEEMHLPPVILRPEKVGPVSNKPVLPSATQPVKEYPEDNSDNGLCKVGRGEVVLQLGLVPLLVQRGLHPIFHC